jgi:hypothetical protein
MLHQDVGHLALLVDRPPQIVVFALDGENHRSEVLFITGPRTLVTPWVGILLATLRHHVESFVRHDDCAFMQQLCDIADAQAEAKGQPHGVANDFSRNAVVPLCDASRRSVHATTLPHWAGP